MARAGGRGDPQQPQFDAEQYPPAPTAENRECERILARIAGPPSGDDRIAAGNPIREA